MDLVIEKLLVWFKLEILKDPLLKIIFSKSIVSILPSLIFKYPDSTIVGRILLIFSLFSSKERFFILQLVIWKNWFFILQEMNFRYLKVEEEKWILHKKVQFSKIQNLLKGASGSLSWKISESPLKIIFLKVSSILRLCVCFLSVFFLLIHVLLFLH